MNSNTLPKALTFDDVLMLPAYSEVLPAEVCLNTRVTESIQLKIPFISSAMDSVTESRMAITMAQAGGIGVIHKNMEPDEQAAEVRAVKKFESILEAREKRVGDLEEVGNVRKLVGLFIVHC